MAICIREDIVCQLAVQLVIDAGRVHRTFSLAIGAQADQSHTDQLVKRRSKALVVWQG